MNSEDDIKLNTGNYYRHCKLKKRNISGLKGDRVKNSDTEEVTFNPWHSSYQKQRHKEVTNKTKYTAKAIVVDGQHLEFTGGNYIETEPRTVKN